MQKENMFFFSFPRQSIFGKAKDSDFFIHIAQISKKISIFAPNYNIYYNANKIYPYISMPYRHVGHTVHTTGAA